MQYFKRDLSPSGVEVAAFVWQGIKSHLSNGVSTSECKTRGAIGIVAREMDVLAEHLFPAFCGIYGPIEFGHCGRSVEFENAM